MASSAATGSEIEWPSNASYYDLGHAIGKGTTAVVYHATCKTNQRQVANKIIDLENCPAEIDDIRVRADAAAAHPRGLWLPLTRPPACVRVCVYHCSSSVRSCR